MATTIQQTRNPLQSVDALLRSLTKSGEEARTEAGGYEGPTTHPIKNVDDSTIEGTEGARSKENQEDVEEQIGAPAVDGSKKEAKKKKAEECCETGAVGLQNRATGEDPENETSSAKGGKEDGGTYTGSSSHPARTDNDELDGSKYAGVIRALRGKIAAAKNAGDAALAAISVESPSAPAKKQATETAAKTAGKELADAIADVGGSVPDSDMQAKTAQVVDDLAKTIIAAYAAAVKTAEYTEGVLEGMAEARREKQAQENDRNFVLSGVRQLLAQQKRASRKAPATKRAEEEPPKKEEMPAAEGDPPADAAPPAPEGGEVGHPEPDADNMGGSPAGDLSPEDLQMLLQALQEAGITPEEIMAAVQGGGAGAPPMGPEAGAPPLGGAAPPMGGAPAGGDVVPPEAIVGKAAAAKSKEQQKAARARRMAEVIAEMVGAN